MRGLIFLNRILIRRMMPISWQVFLLLIFVCHSLSQEVTASPRHLKGLFYTEGITSCSPAQNRLHVAKDTVISVTFSADMNASSINAGTFRIYAAQTGFHAGIYTYNNSTRTATFDPADDFAWGEMVTVVLTAGITYTAGGTLPVPFEWSFTIETKTGSGAFVPPMIDYLTGDNPNAIFSADLDSDGDKDIAVVNNFNPGTVSVFLNAGDSKLQSKTDYTIGNYARSIHISDLDTDGDMDMAVTNYFNPVHRISVLLNNGNGTFQPKTDYTTGSAPESVFSSDLDADGDLDLVSANANSNNVSVLLNNGNGTFQAKTDYTAGTSPQSVFSSDLDADGNMDLVVANASSNNISVLLNNGNATFQAKIDYLTGTYPRSVFSSDLDADGDLDLAVANYNSDNVSILLNNGDGTFLSKIDYTAGDAPQAVSASDLDADGDPDLAVVNFYSHCVSILLNNGDGTFQPKIDYKAGSNPNALFSVDVDGDGDLDLAVTNNTTDKVTLLFNRNWKEDLWLSTDRLSYGPVIIDVTKRLEFKIYNYGIDSILNISSILSSNPVFVVSASSALLLPGDSLAVNVDFKPVSMINYSDSITIISSDPNKPLMKLYLTGSGYYPVISHYPFQNELDISKNTSISVTFSADMNASTINTNTFRINSSQTGLHTGTYNYDSGTKTASFNPDNDFAIGEQVTVVLTTGIAYSAGGNLPVPFEWSFTIEADTGSGAFIPPKTDYLTGDYPYALSSADLDADGDRDLIVANYYSGSVSIFLNNGDGIFLPKTDYASGSGPQSVFPADLDADGDVDLTTANYSASTVSILKNNGNGTFQPKTDYSTGIYPSSVFAGDLDADGDLDLVLSKFYAILIFQCFCSPEQR